MITFQAIAESLQRLIDSAELGPIDPAEADRIIGDAEADAAQLYRLLAHQGVTGFDASLSRPELPPGCSGDRRADRSLWLLAWSAISRPAGEPGVVAAADGGGDEPPWVARATYDVGVLRYLHTWSIAPAPAPPPTTTAPPGERVWVLRTDGRLAAGVLVRELDCGNAETCVWVDGRWEATIARRRPCATFYDEYEEIRPRAGEIMTVCNDHKI